MEQRELEFGRLNMENDSLMNLFVRKIHLELQYPMRISRLDQSNFTRKALQDTITAMKTSPNDIIIVYYSGYGLPPTNPADNFANWRLSDMNKTGLPVSEVENWLRAKNVHLGVLIADCSSQRIDHTPPAVPEATTVEGIILSQEIIKQLFLRTKGIVKLGSSTPSAPGYLNLAAKVNKLNPGTLFTNALCTAFGSLLESSSPDILPGLSFETLQSWTSSNINFILRKSNYVQKPVLEVKNWAGSIIVRKQSRGVPPIGTRWQGLLVNEYDYDQLPQKWVSQPTKQLPPRIDMSIYAPPVIDQGEKGTCVAVSIGYYMRSILEARKQGITDKSQILKRSFSPFYLYANLKMAYDYSCTSGIDAGQALDYIKQNGLPAFSAFPDPNSCQLNQEFRINPSSRIEDYVKLFSITDPKEAKVVAAKQALAEWSPIVVGIQTTGSMANLSFTQTLVPRLKSFVSELMASDNASGPKMEWRPYQANSLDFGHAMCVVGYDDTMLGNGAFKLINSWGSPWGDKGYFWMSYDTFGRFAKYGYQAFLSSTIRPSDNLLDTDLTISHGAFTGEALPFTTSSNSSQLMTYTLTQPQRTNTSFKFTLDVKKQTYLYLITSGEADSAASKVLPRPGYKMIITPGNRLNYPSDNTRLILGGSVGQEYWLFLFSEKEIPNIDDYLLSMNSLKGTFPNRAMRAFSDILISKRLISYKPKKMGFFLRNNPQVRERIVPLLVTMNHVP
ncbi:hypothetical protein GCM10028805_19800 [Spirosoma harenae]